MKQSSFDATIPALDVETSAFGAATSAIAQRSFDATISALNAETSVLMRRRRCSMRRRRRSHGVTGDIDAEFPAISAIAEFLAISAIVELV